MNPNTKTTCKLHFMKNQSGLSLLELLIAMVIGLFLLIGITTSYLSSKKSSVTRNQISILEDNGRIALEILTKTLQHAGYRSTDLAIMQDPFLTEKRPLSSSCGSDIQSIKNTSIFPENITANNTNLAGDTIGVVYLGDDNLNTDCSGKALPAQCRVGASVDANAHRISNAFFVRDGNLECAGSRTNESVLIAENVENIQVLYGLNLDGDDSKSVDRYVNADQVKVGVDSNWWGLVVSIQVAILVKTSMEVKSKPETQSFSILDYKYDSPNDRFQRAVFSTSINLRNL